MQNIHRNCKHTQIIVDGWRILPNHKTNMKFQLFFLMFGSCLFRVGQKGNRSLGLIGPVVGQGTGGKSV